MVNLLRFRLQAEYNVGSSLPPCTGQDAYMQRYVPAFAEVAAKAAPGEAFRPVFLGAAMATIVAEPGEQGHAIAIVEYDNFEALRRVVGSVECEAQAAPHRRAVLADWRFIAVRPMSLPLWPGLGSRGGRTRRPGTVRRGLRRGRRTVR